ncbi:MAG: hypothetical protein ACRCVW_03120 [Brevinema sp.]
MDKLQAQNPDATVARYDKELDLMLVETSFKDTLLRILDNRDEGLDYEAIYWDSNNNTYYFVSNSITMLYPIPSTNTNFIYTIDQEKQHEPIFDSSLKEIFPDTKTPLLYIGSISPLERVYLDPTNQNDYIKKLQFFDTSFHISYDDNDKPLTNIIDSPVYPIIFSNAIYYTDSNKQIFSALNNRMMACDKNDFRLHYSRYNN